MRRLISRTSSQRGRLVPAKEGVRCGTLTPQGETTVEIADVRLHP